MSAFSNLFDNSEGSGENKIGDLFLKTSGPIGREKLLKKRTLVEVKTDELVKKNKKKLAKAEKVEKVENHLESDDEDEESEVETEDEALPSKPTKSKKRKADDDIEGQYFKKLLADENSNLEQKSEQLEKASLKSDDSDDSDDSNESDSNSDSKSDSDKDTKKKTRTQAAKQIDLKEDELEKSERTVFVGNVTSEAITSKQIYKQFKQLFVNYGEVESIRFRSISFDEALPRKFAYAKKSFHSARDTVNAYVVYKQKDASLKASKQLNATVFEKNHLRTDHVAHPSPKDNRRTIFVGNLDFEEKEENLWRYFQSKTNNDVESVRVVRDSKTNIGKGFALIQFKDSISVNLALLLNDKPLTYDDEDDEEDDEKNKKNKKKKGRKLRISRAKKNAKPSILSPNHVENTKKQYASKRSQDLSEQQKTKLGKAQSVLGKADRNTAGRAKRVILEGSRAIKGQNIAGIKGLKGGKVKKPRITKRSANFKTTQKEEKAEKLERAEKKSHKPRKSYGKPKH